MSDPSDNRSFLKKFGMPIFAFVGLMLALGYLAVEEGWFAPSYVPAAPQAAAPPSPPSVPSAPSLPPLPAFAQTAAQPATAIIPPPAPENLAPAQSAPPPPFSAAAMTPGTEDAAAAAPAPGPQPSAVPPAPRVERPAAPSSAVEDDVRRRQVQNAQLTLEAARLTQEAAIEETRLRIARARNEIEKLKAPPPAPPPAALPIVPTLPAAPAMAARDVQEPAPRLYLVALRAGPDGVRRATVAGDTGRYDVTQGSALPGGWTVEAIGSASITIARAAARGVPARRTTIDLAAPMSSDASPQPSSPAPVGALPVLPIAPGFVGGRP